MLSKRDSGSYVIITRKAPYEDLGKHDLTHLVL